MQRNDIPICHLYYAKDHPQDTSSASGKFEYATSHEIDSWDVFLVLPRTSGRPSLLFFYKMEFFNKESLRTPTPYDRITVYGGRGSSPDGMK